MRKLCTLVLILCFAFSSLIILVNAENWVEVVRFTGSNNVSEFFTCEHVEWRIRWEFNATKLSLSLFRIYIYGTKDGEVDRESVVYYSYVLGTYDPKSGVSNHDQQGTFAIRVTVADTVSYTVIIEQNLDSIPEFPSWIILPLFLIAILFGIIVRKKFRRL